MSRPIGLVILKIKFSEVCSMAAIIAQITRANRERKRKKTRGRERRGKEKEGHEKRNDLYY